MGGHLSKGALCSHLSHTHGCFQYPWSRLLRPEFRHQLCHPQMPLPQCVSGTGGDRKGNSARAGGAELEP